MNYSEEQIKKALKAPSEKSYIKESFQQDIYNAMQTAIIALEDVIEENYKTGGQLKQKQEIRIMRDRLAEIQREYESEQDEEF